MNRKMFIKEFLDEKQKDFLKNLYFEFNIEKIEFGYFGFKNEFGCQIKIKNTKNWMIIFLND